MDDLSPSALRQIAEGLRDDAALLDGSRSEVDRPVACLIDSAAWIGPAAAAFSVAAQQRDRRARPWACQR